MLLIDLFGGLWHGVALGFLVAIAVLLSVA